MYPMKEILASHDLVFLSPVNDPIGGGLPLGNGDSGALVWLTENALHLQLNKTDLWDCEPVTNGFCSYDEEHQTNCRNGAHLTWNLPCPAFDSIYQKRYTQRLRLYDATGIIENETPFFAGKTEVFCPSGRGLVCLRTQASFAEALPTELLLERWGSRSFPYWYACFITDPTVGLSGTESHAEENCLCITQTLRDRAFAVAVRVDTDTPLESRRQGSHGVKASFEEKKELSFTAYASVQVASAPEEAKALALSAVNAAAKEGYDALHRAHAAAWADFWSKSYVCLPDMDFTENLWYLNLYYANSQMRGKSPSHFCNGIWGFYHDFVPWNNFFHYNMQLSTFPLETCNHPELLETYYNFRIDHLPEAKHFAKVAWNVEGALYADICDGLGQNYRWLDHNTTCGAQIAMELYSHYLYSGDREYLQKKALPVMKACADFYVGMLHREEDGLFHLHQTQAYEGTDFFQDSITDMCMIRALFPALIRELPPEQTAPYEEILSALPDYNTTGKFLPEEMKDGVFLVGVGKGQKIKDGRLLCVGKRETDGEWMRCTFGVPGYGNPNGFPDTEMAPVFPSGLVGIRDRGSDLYNMIHNTVCLHPRNLPHNNPWGIETDGSMEMCMGWCLLPLYLARMGLAEELYTEIERKISAWIPCPQGLGDYGPYVRTDRYFHERFCMNNAENRATKNRFDVPQWNFRHFDYEALPIISASVNEMILQSYDGVLRFFGALKPETPVAFSLAARGGFLAEGAYENGKADITITSRLGGELSVILHNLAAEPTFTDGKGNALSFTCEGDTYTLATRIGDTVRIRTPEAPHVEKEYRENTGMKSLGNARLGHGPEFTGQ